MKALGLFGLAIVLFAILIVGPYVKRFTEGFSSQPAAQSEAAKAAEEIKNQTMSLMKDIETFNKLLEDPNLDSTTKAKIVKEKEEKQAEIQKITGQSLPSATVQPPKEGFEGILSTDLEKNSKATDLLQKATQSTL